MSSSRVVKFITTIKQFNKCIKPYVRDRDRIDILSSLVIALSTQSSIISLGDCMERAKRFVEKVDAGCTDWHSYMSRLSSLEIPESVWGNLVELAVSFVNTAPSHPHDVMAIAYREFLKDSGKYDNRNIILTPHHVAGFMADMLGVVDEDSILDPCSGTGMLVLACSRNNPTSRFIAVEKDPSLFLALVANTVANKLLDKMLYLACGDGLTTELPNTPNKAIINPPYAGSLPFDFISKAVSLSSGTVVAIVPSTTPKNLPDNKQLCSVVTMPSAIFNDSAVTVNTSVITLSANNTDSTVYESIPDDGYVSVQRKGRVDKHGIWESEKKRVINSLANGGMTASNKKGEDYIPLGDVFHMENGKIPSSHNIPNGEFPFITAAKDWSRYSTFSHDCVGIAMALRSSGSLGRTHYINGKVAISNLCVLLTVKPEYSGRVVPKFYNEYFSHIRTSIASMGKGATKKTISLEDLSSFPIRLFPIDTQECTIRDVIDVRDDALRIVKECTATLEREMGE